MHKYSYRAMNERGRPVRGGLSAVNESDLYQQLQGMGLELIDCRIQKQSKFSIPFIGGRIKARDLIQMFVHMEQLQLAGVPLLESLSDIRDSVDNPALRDMVSEVYRDVSEGKALSEAMANHPKVFSNIFISLIASGEETGNLASSFAQLIVFLKWSDMMRRRVIKAMSYPIFVTLLFIGVLSLLMLFTVPQITEFLKELDQELPYATVALINTSDFFMANYPYVFATPVIFIIVHKMLRNAFYGYRYHTDAIYLRIPVIGDVIRKIALSRFSRTFGALYKSGLEILKSFEASTNTVTNKVIIEALVRAKGQISDGSSISAALANTGEFPALVTRMVRIGEDSGNLTKVLDQVGEFYDQDVDESVSRMIGMVTPTLTIFLGFMILWIAIGVFGPIYGIMGQVGI